MQDIKPDTSLYTDTPSRLEALAKTLRCHANDQVLEERASNSAGWVPANGHAELFCKRMAEGWDFRIKPKPRELWVLFATDGTMSGADDKKFQSINGGTVVRFVEQPE